MRKLVMPLVISPSHNDDTCNVSSINIISAIIGLNLKQLIGVFDTSTGIAEGIGEVGPTCLPTLDGGGGLSCYTKQGQTIQFSNIDCSLFPMPLNHPWTPASMPHPPVRFLAYS